MICNTKSKLTARCHDSGNILKADLFSDVLGFNVVVLVRDEHHVLLHFFPAVLLNPRTQCVV